MLMPSNFMPEIKQEADFKLKSGVRVRFFRREPFKFMGDIEKWMNDLNIGEPLAFEMNTDANGWVNLAVAYREYKPVPDNVPDANLLMFDIASLLKDVAELLSDRRTIADPRVDFKREAAGAD
jgi:hypothetical protein